MKTRFFTLAALALALAACNNDNENLNGGPVAAQFTANIAPATRASGTTWTAGEKGQKVTISTNFHKSCANSTKRQYRSSPCFATNG